MTVTVNSRVVRFTADNDVWDSGNKKLKIAGARLAANTANAQASIREGDASGVILYQLSSLANGSDESALPVTVDSGKLFVDISGAGSEVYVYLE